MEEKRNNFFSVLWDSQTYLNLFYLLVSFPLGIIYFCVLVTGISLGFGLIITWLGIPILLGMMFLWREFARFERKSAELILEVDIPYKIKKHKKEPKFWDRLKSHFKDGYTWTSLGYLFMKFPLGIFSFVVLVTLISVALSFIVLPLFYYFDQIGLLAMEFCINNTFCWVKGYLGAAIYSVIGIFLLFAFLHVLNGLAKVSGWLAKVMLEKR
jgi:putative sensor protein